MTTKTNNIVYWISTIIFSALMIFSASDGLQPTQPAIQLIHDSLGYPRLFYTIHQLCKITWCHCYSDTRTGQDKRLGLCRFVF